MAADDLPEWVVGHAIHTTNAAEADADRALIPGLWQRATTDAALCELNRTGDEFFAVLTDYESDASGGYAQVVGVGVADANDVPAGMIAVRLPRLSVRSYPFAGPMPMAIIEAWQQVWAHTGDGTLDRAFATDVEIHRRDGSGELLISIKA